MVGGQDSATIHLFCASLFTKAVVCDRNSGESQVPQKLTILLYPLETSANIHPHTATCSAVDAFTQHMRLQPVHTKKIVLLSSVEVTADSV